MKNPALDKWLPVAMGLEAVNEAFALPIPILLGEAMDLAHFIEEHRDPVADLHGVPVRPGLRNARQRLPESAADDLLELAEGLWAADTAYLLAVSAVPLEVRARAEHVLEELAAALEFTFDDGVEDANDPALLRANATYTADMNGTDALAIELADVAALAAAHLKELVDVADLDPRLIDEAFVLTAELRARSANAVTPERLRQLRELRDRLATLLVNRMARVRAAARYVFRKHPDILRRAISTYERHRRRAARRVAAKAAEAKLALMRQALGASAQAAAT